MLGKAQKEWLFEGISRSEAIFKFIATSVPMAGGGSDRWDGYPRERTDILGYIRQKKISGVIFPQRRSALRGDHANPQEQRLERYHGGTASRTFESDHEWNRKPL